LGINRKLRILILAYACEPDKGSEQRVGWSWANELAQRHEVWVVTRLNNRTAIETALTRRDIKDLHFVYHDLPGWMRFWKKGHYAIYPYYLLWHASLRVKLRNLHNQVGFDVIHHLTFAADWLPNFLSSKVGVPTVVGPLAGYRVDNAMTTFISLPHLAVHYLKALARQVFVRLRTKELRDFSLVISNNEDYTRYYIKQIGVKRCIDISTQGYSASLYSGNADSPKSPCEKNGGKPLEIIMGGRLKYWKGFDAAVRIFAELKTQGIDFRATLVGSGTRWYRKRIHRSIERSGVSDSVQVLESLPRHVFLEKLRTSDLFLYPTFYGSGDAVMLEAIGLNVPVVCFPSRGAREVFGEGYPYMSKDFSVESITEVITNLMETKQAFGEIREAILKQQDLHRKIDLLTDAYQSLVLNVCIRG
jgi:glycosyltransferase involved in cell wall biosynthesis